MNSAQPGTDAPPRITPTPTGAGAGRHAGRWWLLAAAAVAGFVLWRVEPGSQFYYPKCYLHLATGLKCPGCGVLRATHALLQGDLAAAWRLNPLWVAFSPLVAWTGLVTVAGLFGRRLPNLVLKPWMIGALIGLTVGYGIARNVPGWDWLG